MERISMPSCDLEDIHSLSSLYPADAFSHGRKQRSVADLPLNVSQTQFNFEDTLNIFTPLRPCNEHCMRKS